MPLSGDLTTLWLLSEAGALTPAQASAAKAAVIAGARRGGDAGRRAAAGGTTAADEPGITHADEASMGAQGRVRKGGAVSAARGLFRRGEPRNNRFFSGAAVDQGDARLRELVSGADMWVTEGQQVEGLFDDEWCAATVDGVDADRATVDVTWDDGTTSVDLPLDSIRRPKNQIPDSLSEFNVDPRTGLPLIDVPEQFGGAQGPFRDLESTVLHFFEPVTKCGKKGWQHGAPRILIITDQDIFQCSVDGLINRCEYVRDIGAMLADQTSTLGFRFPNSFDMLFKFASQEQQQQAVHIIQTLQRFLGAKVSEVTNSAGTTVLAGRGDWPAGGRPIDHTMLALQKPADWQFDLHSVRTKASLLAELRRSAA